MHRLLVVEDDLAVADYLRQGLSESGYAVDVARNGHDGCAMAMADEYAVVLLDLMLPGMDGFQVLSHIRKKSNTPVLMLTARDRVDDRVKGLSAGADDYLVKPFAYSELEARVAALLRRGRSEFSEQTLICVADLQVDLMARQVRRAGKRVDLTPKEFQVLSLLVRRRGQVVTRTTLAERVWNVHFDTESNMVEVAVRRLRSKVDDAFPAKLIHTVRGVGYALEDRG